MSDESSRQRRIRTYRDRDVGREGIGRVRDFDPFLRYARGSLFEVETQLVIASEIGPTPAEHTTDLLRRIDVLSRRLLALRRSL